MPELSVPPITRGSFLEYDLVETAVETVAGMQKCVRSLAIDVLAVRPQVDRA